MIDYDRNEIIDISEPPEDVLSQQEQVDNEDPSVNDPYWWC